jgi:hypothetical protein
MNILFGWPSSQLTCELHSQANKLPAETWPVHQQDQILFKFPLAGGCLVPKVQSEGFTSNSSCDTLTYQHTGVN